MTTPSMTMAKALGGYAKITSMDQTEQTPTKRQPVTGLLAVGAIGVTIWIWNGGDIGFFTLDGRVWPSQPWRALTPILPHLDVFHLAFNVYWLSVFGARIEDTLGSLKMAAIVVVLAAGSSLAQYTFSSSGVGLSGVGYGLFGMLWVLHYHDRRFTNALTTQIIQLFVGWFFLCILLSWMNVWAVGNVAHGAGAVFGASLGWCIAANSTAKKLASRLVLVFSILFIVLAATFGRPHLNLSGQIANEFAYDGWKALDQQDSEEAVQLLEQAVAKKPDQHAWWHNLGIAYHQQQRYDEALTAYQRAFDLEPSDESHKSTLLEMKLWLAAAKEGEGEGERAEQLYREVLALDETNANVWFGLAVLQIQKSDISEARKSLAKALALEPANEEFQTILDALNNLNSAESE